MPKNRKNGNGNDNGRRFFKFWEDVYHSENFKQLTWVAKLILLDMLSQYNGFNNGKIKCVWASLRDEIPVNKGTFIRALRELIYYGFIIRAQEKRGSTPALYTLTIVDDAGDTWLTPQPWRTPKELFSRPKRKAPAVKPPEPEPKPPEPEPKPPEPEPKLSVVKVPAPPGGQAEYRKLIKEVTMSLKMDRPKLQTSPVDLQGNKYPSNLSLRDQLEPLARKHNDMDHPRETAKVCAVDDGLARDLYESNPTGYQTPLTRVCAIEASAPTEETDDGVVNEAANEQIPAREPPEEHIEISSQWVPPMFEATETPAYMPNNGMNPSAKGEPAPGARLQIRPKSVKAGRSEKEKKVAAEHIAKIRRMLK